MNPRRPNVFPRQEDGRPVLFGSSGIRGVVGKEITPELAMAVGAAVGSRYDDLVIGRDPRVSGPMLAAAFAAGAMSVGTDVCDAGMVSTPTLARGAKGYDAGVVITASHNPAEYNGMKLWNPDGLAFTEEQQGEVEAAMKRGATRADWRFSGQLKQRTDLAEHHLESILSSVGAADLTVAVDCGCGATSHLTPVLLRRMGCRVIALNAHPDGHFPGRDPEPLEENLTLLTQTVKATGADLGVAHDGDGDRMVAVDDRGRYVGGDRLLPLFAKVHARKAIVVPVDASMVLDDLLPGVAVHRTRVGDVFVGQELKRLGADFGGEPSGTWIFPRETLCPDGPLAAAILVGLVQSRGRPLSEMLDNLPEYPILREAHRFVADQRLAVKEALDRAFAGLDAEVTRVDGWRAAFPDGWFVVRLSGTEPKVRITAEARERVRAEELLEKGRALVHAAVSTAK